MKVNCLRSQMLGASSFMALALYATPAFAACSPDPTVFGTTTTCSGTDSNGIAITTNTSTVAVQSGATVANSSVPAISVAIASGASDPFRSTTITVDGAVDGGASTGIAVTNGTNISSINYEVGTRAAVTVGSGGTVTGGNAITAAPSTGNPFAYTLVDLDNSGTISGSAGAALVATNPYAGFSTIINRASGIIAGISAPVGTITNAGTIDGGSGSAIGGAISGAYIYPNGITNSGTILSNGSLATVSSYTSSVNPLASISNTGMIANNGTGSAIGGSFATITNGLDGVITTATGDTVSVTGLLTVDNSGTISNIGSGIALRGGAVLLNNQAGGTISASGTVISGSNGIKLTNRGTITGNISAGSEDITYSPSIVDSIGGTIVGNVTFGASNDCLYATYSVDTGLSTGVTGTIDGGAGTDTVQVMFTTDATLSSSIVLPTNFEVLALAPDSGTTVTLAQGFASPSNGIVLSGSGKLVNAASLSANGSVIYSGNPANFTNSGTITSTGSPGEYAVVLGSSSSFANSGTIVSSDGGVHISPSTFDNSGTITATGIAVNAFLGGWPFNNSGTIRSTGGTGLILRGTSYGPASEPSNSGTIEGAEVGVELSTALVNTGLISSAGTAVELGSYGVLKNLAGGVVTGTTLAIAPAAGSTIFNSVVMNAGTINGDVSFASPFQSYSDHNNRYFALAGGILNGNLTLGQGDILVTEIDNTGTGAFAGISGTVSASDSYLRYEVRSDTSATVAPVSGFVSIGYELYDNAALTLSSNGSLSQPLTFAGTGNVELTADITVNNQPAIQSTGLLSASGYSSAPNALSITSGGTVTLNRTDANRYPGAAIWLGTNDSLSNTGSIIVNDTSGATYGTMAAIYGGTISNSGTISFDNGIGVMDVQSLTNSGTIVAGGAAANLYFASTKVTNSGALSSTGDAAVLARNGGSAVVENLLGGTISGGGGVAIEIGGGSVSNAGTINGSVDLGYSSYGYSATPGTYIADGGTINGNLSFGAGDDTLFALGGKTGVSGTIDPGAGINTWGRFYRSDASAQVDDALPTGFQRELIEAIGSGVTVTINGPGATSVRDLTLAGDGSIAINADISGRVLATSDATLAIDSAGVLASLTNNGVLSGGIVGTVKSFNNTGTISTTSGYSNALSLSLSGPAIVSNSGIITAGPGVNAANLYAAPGAGVTFVNTGTINGNVILTAGDDRFVEALSANLSGTVYGGDGTDTLAIDITGGGTLDASLFNQLANQFANFEKFKLTGSGSISVNGVLPVATIELEPGTAFELATGSTLQTQGPVAITGSAGDDHVINHGTILGKVMLSGGNDSFDYYAASSVSGTVDGGAGIDRLSLHLNGTSASPTPIDFSPYAGFEQMTLEGGTGSISGDVSFDTIAVNKGRLIGLSGSNIFAGQGITVAPGATFGSAGMVRADIAVEGTLSPGASPDTMTINGNVTLVGGSTTLFEMTPTVSDALVISGKLTIGSGATLDITGNRPLTPGVKYDLITANDGIEGSFSTINKADTVLGFLHQTQTALELLGTLQLPSDANPQVTAITDYINSTLIDGTATTAIYNRVASLVGTDGFANAVTIATLGPQPYASASQVAFEKGIVIANAIRALPHGREGLFTLGQALGAWHHLRGTRDTGLYGVDQNLGGFLGGIGYRTGSFAITMFGGMAYARQTINGLSARTRSDGGFVGGTLDLTMRGFDLGGTVIWDGSSADTTRTLYDLSTATGHYDLHTLTLDGHVGYAIPLGTGVWRLGPQIALTYVQAKRGAAQEVGGGAFALDVAARTQDATFLDAEFRFDMTPGVKLRPYIAGGWRHRLDGNAALASAGFAGVTTLVTVAGAPYGEDFARVSAGFDWSLTAQLTLFAHGSDSFNSGTGVRDINVGLRLPL